jgi:hypothetical protein
VHDATLAGVVGDGVVLRAPVVPERDGARLPPEAHLEVRALHVLQEVREQHVTLPSVMPRMRVVKLLLTYKPRRPVRAWVRTTGCSIGGHWARMAARSVPTLCPPAMAFSSGTMMSCSAVHPSSSARRRGDSASYAAYMEAQHVSPPRLGSSTARSTDPKAGCAMKEESECHEFAPSRSGVVWSSTVISGWSGWCFANAWASNGPNHDANRICASGVSEC